MGAFIRVTASALTLLGIAPFTLAAQLVNRAPDVYPGTLPEMRTPGYWIARMANPDEVLITPGGIERMNESFRELMRRPDALGDMPLDRKSALISWWPGFFLHPPDINSLAPEALADTVKSWISSEVRYLRRGRFGNAAGVRYSGRDLDRFERETAADRVPRAVHVRQGISVRHTRLRVIPSLFPLEQGICDSALSVSGKTIPITVHWDVWNNGFIKIGNPVHVLHASRSGEFLFVVNGPRFGWARAEDIAFGGAKEIGGFADPPVFVVCTGDRAPLYTDTSCLTASGWFGMGDRLPLAERSNPRKVRIPVRRDDGALAAGAAWLAEDADTHVGWLPYTRRNIVLTAFKLLDTPYDWSGAWLGRDHITTYRDIFAVFGFVLSWHDALFTFFGAKRDVLEPGTGRDSQFRAILSHEPFVTVMSCGGHAKLLLGEYRGTPVVFDHYGHGYTDSAGTYVELCRSFVGDMNIPAYFLNRPVTFLELK